MQRKAKGHTQLQWEAKFFRCGCACVYCGEPLTLARATKDHLTPTSRGGSDAIENLAPACFVCNAKKGNKTFEEFFAARGAFSARREKFTALVATDPATAFTMISTGGRPELVRSLPSPPRGSNFEFVDDPQLAEKLRRETSDISWAWRNPKR